MYGVDMYYTVKTLFSKGISRRKIAKDLGISRNTVAKIEKMVASGQSWPSQQTRQKILSVIYSAETEVRLLSLKRTM